MTPEIKRELLATLAEVWELAPDVRLGQLMAHIGFLGEDHVGRGLGDIDDDELLAVLYCHRSELAGRLEGAPAGLPITGATISVSSSPMSLPTTPTTEAGR